MTNPNKNGVIYSKLSLLCKREYT